MGKQSIENIAKRFEAYKTAMAECDKAEAAWDVHVDSEECEAAFDRARKAEIKAFDSLVGAVISFTGGKLDRNDVRRIIAFKIDEFEQIINRAA